MKISWLSLLGAARRRSFK